MNSQIVQFVKRVGRVEGPHIADFYVTLNNDFYVKLRHGVGQLLSDAEKLRTDWALKRSVTASEARRMDQTQARLDVFTKLVAEAKAK